MLKQISCSYNDQQFFECVDEILLTKSCFLAVPLKYLTRTVSDTSNCRQTTTYNKYKLNARSTTDDCRVQSFSSSIGKICKTPSGAQLGVGALSFGLRFAR